MKWNYAIMNPPYDGNLHLKFLEKVIEVTDKVVTIQPVRWLQDPDVKEKKKKYVNTIIDNILELETVNADTAAELFNARFGYDLGIYICSKNNKDKKFDIDEYKFTIDNINVSDVIKKINENISTVFNDVIEYNKLDGWRVRVDKIRPLPVFDPRGGVHYEVNRKGAYKYYFKHSYIFYNGKRDGKWWSDFCNKNQFSKEPGTPIPNSIKFNTKEECINFEKSLDTKFMQFMKCVYQKDVNVPFKKLPFMNDYTKQWTDERFKSYFKLTNDDWNKIETIMKKYFSDEH